MVKLYEVQLATGGVKFVLGWRCPVIDWRGIEIKQLPVTWYSYGAHLFPPISMWIKQFLFKASCFYSGDLGLLSEIVERSKWTCVFFLSIASSSSSFSSDRQCSSFHHLMYYRTGAWCVKPSMYQCRLMWCVKPSMYQCRLMWCVKPSMYQCRLMWCVITCPWVWRRKKIYEFQNRENVIILIVNYYFQPLSYVIWCCGTKSECTFDIFCAYIVTFCDFVDDKGL